MLSILWNKWLIACRIRWINDSYGNVKALLAPANMIVVKMILFNCLNNVDALSPLNYTRLIPVIHYQDHYHQNAAKSSKLRPYALFAMVKKNLSG